MAVPIEPVDRNTVARIAAAIEALIEVQRDGYLTEFDRDMRLNEIMVQMGELSQRLSRAAE